ADILKLTVRQPAKCLARAAAVVPGCDPGMNCGEHCAGPAKKTRRAVMGACRVESGHIHLLRRCACASAAWSFELQLGTCARPGKSCLNMAAMQPQHSWRI